MVRDAAGGVARTEEIGVNALAATASVLAARPPKRYSIRHADERPSNRPRKSSTSFERG